MSKRLFNRVKRENLREQDLPSTRFSWMAFGAERWVYLDPGEHDFVGYCFMEQLADVSELDSFIERIRAGAFRDEMLVWRANARHLWETGAPPTAVGGWLQAMLMAQKYFQFMRVLQPLAQSADRSRKGAGNRPESRAGALFRAYIRSAGVHLTNIRDWHDTEFSKAPPEIQSAVASISDATLRKWYRQVRPGPLKPGSRKKSN